MSISRGEGTSDLQDSTPLIQVQLHDKSESGHVSRLKEMIEQLKKQLRFEQAKNVEMSEEMNKMRATIAVQNQTVRQLQESLQQTKESEKELKEKYLKIQKDDGTKQGRQNGSDITSKSMRDLEFKGRDDSTGRLERRYGSFLSNSKDQQGSDQIKKGTENDGNDEDNDNNQSRTMLSIVEEDLKNIVRSNHYQKQLDPTVLKTLAKSIVAIKYTSKVMNSGRGSDGHHHHHHHNPHSNLNQYLGSITSSNGVLSDETTPIGTASEPQPILLTAELSGHSDEARKKAGSQSENKGTPLIGFQPKGMIMSKKLAHSNHGGIMSRGSNSSAEIWSNQELAVSGKKVDSNRPSLGQILDAQQQQHSSHSNVKCIAEEGKQIALNQQRISLPEQEENQVQQQQQQLSNQSQRSRNTSAVKVDANSIPRETLHRVVETRKESNCSVEEITGKQIVQQDFQGQLKSSNPEEQRNTSNNSPKCKDITADIPVNKLEQQLLDSQNQEIQQQEKPQEEQQLDIEGLTTQLNPSTNDKDQQPICGSSSSSSNSFSSSSSSSQHSGGSTPKNSEDADMFQPFTHFFVLGCDKTDLKEFETMPAAESVLLPGKLLYSFSDRSYPQGHHDPFDLIKEQVSEYAFPFGIEAKKITVSNDDRQPIQALIIPPTRHGLQDKFFFFKMRSQEVFKQIQVESQKNQLLKVLNPNKHLYFTCLQLKDYSSTNDDTTNNNIDSTRQKQSGSQQQTFWRHQKVFCFVSYYPFFDLFTRLLATIQDSVKVSRQFKLMSDQNIDVLSQIDSEYVQKHIQQNLVASLRQWQSIQFSHLASTYSFQVESSDQPIPFRLPNISQLRLNTLSWTLIGPLQALSLSNFLFILFAILQEQHIIFLSNNLSLLTKTIACFEALLSPFQWPYPIIYSVPENLTGLLGSPQPIILGLNKGSKYLLANELVENHSDHIFVLLDEGTIITQNTNYINSFKQTRPSFGLRSSLAYHYSSINKDVTSQERVLTLPQYLQVYQTESYRQQILAGRKTNNMGNNKQQIDVYEQIMDIVNQALVSKIVSHIPTIPVFEPDDKFLDYNHIRKAVLLQTAEEDKPFINYFCSTSSQIFLYFCEDFYNLLEDTGSGRGACK